MSAPSRARSPSRSWRTCAPGCAGPRVAVLLAASAVAAWLADPRPRARASGLVMIGGRARALHLARPRLRAPRRFFAFPLSLLRLLRREQRARARRAGAARQRRGGEPGLGTSSTSLGKLLGNAGPARRASRVGFMVAAMAMQVVRGEGPLEPVTYLAALPASSAGPASPWVAVLALVFECAPGLSGRFGDVAYFFVWGASRARWASRAWKPGRRRLVARVFDFTGLGFVVERGGARRRHGALHARLHGGRRRACLRSSFRASTSHREAARLPARSASSAPPAARCRSLSCSSAASTPPARRPSAARGAAGFRPSPEGSPRPSCAPRCSALARVAPDVALTFRARPLLGLLGVLGRRPQRRPCRPCPSARSSCRWYSPSSRSRSPTCATRERAAGLAGDRLRARRGGATASLPGSSGRRYGVALVLAGVPAPARAGRRSPGRASPRSPASSSWPPRPWRSGDRDRARRRRSWPWRSPCGTSL